MPLRLRNPLGLHVGVLHMVMAVAFPNANIYGIDPVDTFGNNLEATYQVSPSDGSAGLFVAFFGEGGTYSAPTWPHSSGPSTRTC